MPQDAFTFEVQMGVPHFPQQQFSPETGSGLGCVTVVTFDCLFLFFPLEQNRLLGSSSASWHLPSTSFPMVVVLYYYYCYYY